MVSWGRIIRWALSPLTQGQRKFCRWRRCILWTALANHQGFRRDPKSSSGHLAFQTLTQKSTSSHLLVQLLHPSFFLPRFGFQMLLCSDAFLHYNTYIVARQHHCTSTMKRLLWRILSPHLLPASHLSSWQRGVPGDAESSNMGQWKHQARKDRALVGGLESMKYYFLIFTLLMQPFLQGTEGGVYGSFHPFLVTLILWGRWGWKKVTGPKLPRKLHGWIRIYSSPPHHPDSWKWKPAAIQGLWFRVGLA